MIGLDVYEEGNHSSQMLAFEELKRIFKGKKILALSECGSIPFMEPMKRDKTIWSFYMPWYGEHTKNRTWNSVNDWKTSLLDQDVFTLDNMPSNLYTQ
jgi:mannan endo-1,4-beta-mannosidase